MASAFFYGFISGVGATGATAAILFLIREQGSDDG